MRYLLAIVAIVGILSMPCYTVVAQKSATRVFNALYKDISPALRSIPSPPPRIINLDSSRPIKNMSGVPPRRSLNKGELRQNSSQDYSLQRAKGESPLAPPSLIIEGIENRNGYLPPDPNIDVGPNHVVEMVNASLQIWSRAGVSLFGPVDNSVIWEGFNGPWDGSNDGDPIVLYDAMANRWLVSQFALPNFPNGPFYELVAVSTGPDPTGTWHRFAFEFTDNMPDYPKFGVWPNGYYLTVNYFAAGSLNYNGCALFALDRAAMLAGDPNPRAVEFSFTAAENPYSLLPADLDGPLPPANSPHYTTYVADWGGPQRLEVFTTNIDWTIPANSVISAPRVLAVAPFDMNMCNFSRSCIRQPGTSQGLDALSDRLMFRLQYRNFGSHESMVACHTVDVDGRDRAGIRWYELRKVGGAGLWNIQQQGTYQAASTGQSIWMGSVAMNRLGQIALGFTSSGPSLAPNVRYVGRAPSDPAGLFTTVEQNVGPVSTAFQTHGSGRWGDYSSMIVDPIDDSTFWICNEYVRTSGPANWGTKIARFALTGDFGGLTLADYSPKAGTSGSVLTLAGSGFSKVKDSMSSGIFVGGIRTEASQVVNDNRILAQVGDGATGLVQVRDTLGASATSGEFLFSAKLPYRLSFETPWRSRLAVRDIPSQHSAVQPPSGNTWRRDDDLASAGMTEVSQGMYPPGTGRSMRFHSWNIPAGQSASFRFAIQLQNGYNVLQFDYVNTDGFDFVEVWIDPTSNGDRRLLGVLGVAGSWSPFEYDLRSYGAGHATIEFVAHSDNGTSDIGIDEIVVIQRAFPVLNIHVYLEGWWDGSAQNPSDFTVELWQGADIFSANRVWSGVAASGTDGWMTVQPSGLDPGFYWLVIRHSGHIALVSGGEVPVFPDETNEWEFTTASNQALGFETTKLHPMGGFMMRSGDANSDYDVSGADYLEVSRNFGRSSLAPPP